MDVYANGLLPVTVSGSSGTTAPASGVVETWTVTALGAAFPTLNVGQHVRLIDPNAQSEIILCSQMSPGATSIQVVRGAEGTTPVAHATGASYTPFIETARSWQDSAGGQLLDSATTMLATQAGAASTTTWTTVVGVEVIVPPGIPYYLDLIMGIGIFVNSAAVGAAIHFNIQIRNAAGTSVHAIAPYGAGGSYSSYSDEYYVVPVAGQNTLRTHVEHWEMPPLAATDAYTIAMMCTDSGAGTKSAGWNTPVSGLGQPTVLTARRS